ncbi:hypothetical protein THASP1DRAFT_33357 [Thamnocephalis sphaerospora]|uniref:F-box domain-containing protein n=1 Tax=Thamnocephalis sphaerospora TaxID=78915 RepID=A0A4P9XGS6_9FUNG|nr:hypothetical protein THASP1DRAFT_33357 [Thamnocephalis sphaerospora]|eukprot:RKP04832.1 hypothetical protein THASP1DRAFT_33357 [Thamnocephalis sphaerospora]
MDRPPTPGSLALERPCFDRLPLELRLYHVYATLPVTDLAQCRAVSRSWRAIVDETLLRAHPYQRTLALRSLLHEASTRSNRRADLLPPTVGSSRGHGDSLRTAAGAYSCTGHYATMCSLPSPYSCMPLSAADSFPLLSLDAWEAAFYDLSVPRAFDSWFRAMHKTGKANVEAAVAGVSARGRRDSALDGTARRRVSATDVAIATGRALLAEADAGIFLYTVCRGVAQRPSYSANDDVQSGLCIGFLNMSLDMYDRLRAAADTLNDLAQAPVPSSSPDDPTQAADCNVNGAPEAAQEMTDGQHASLLASLEAHLATQLLVRQQQLYAHMLQQIAMSPRFLLRYASFCFTYLGKLFAAFNTLPGVAARALATLVHSIVTLPDGVVTARTLNVILICLASKEPLALSLLARHQLMTRYASLVGAEEAEACRVDLAEVRRSVNAVDVDEAPAVDGEAGDLLAPFSVASLLFLHNARDAQGKEVDSNADVPRVSSSASAVAADKHATSSPLVWSAASIDAAMCTAVTPPLQPRTLKLHRRWSQDGTEDNDNSLRVSVEERLAWLFEHVTALSVTHQQSNTSVNKATSDAQKKMAEATGDMRVEMRLSSAHASAILPFIVAFEAFLALHAEHLHQGQAPPVPGIGHGSLSVPSTRNIGV